MFILGVTLYLAASVLILAFAARRSFGQGAGAAVGVWRRLLTWAALSGLCGSVLFSLTGCTWLYLLERGAWRESLPGWIVCSVFANVWSLTVVAALLPGYLALLAVWVRFAGPAPVWEQSRRGVVLGAGLLALPGFAVVLASYLFPAVFGWKTVWQDFLRYAPWLAVSFWGALLLPRFAVRSLRPGAFAPTS